MIRYKVIATGQVIPQNSLITTCTVLGAFQYFFRLSGKTEVAAERGAGGSVNGTFYKMKTKQSNVREKVPFFRCYTKVLNLMMMMAQHFLKC